MCLPRHAPMGRRKNLFERTVWLLRGDRLRAWTKSGELQKILRGVTEHSVQQLGSRSAIYLEVPDIPGGSESFPLPS